jgi:hypothetical protein
LQFVICDLRLNSIANRKLQMHGRSSHATLNKAPVNASHLRDFLREQAGIRIEGATGDYLHRTLQDRQNASVALMGGDARTGVAVRRTLAADVLRQEIRSHAADDQSTGA